MTSPEFVKTEAIVLRVLPYSQTSQIVQWFTRDTGRVATLIKGARRPRSAFLGQYDTYYTCELVYYARTGASLCHARECTPLNFRNAFRTNWRATASASYCCDLIMRALPIAAPQERLYRLLESTLDVLSGQSKPPPDTALSCFELQLLRELGLAPSLRSCAVCGTKTDTGENPVQFSLERGGVICPSCSHKLSPHATNLGADCLAMLSAWENQDTINVAYRTRSTERQSAQLREILGRFLDYHVDLELPSRAIAYQALQT